MLFSLLSLASVCIVIKQKPQREGERDIVLYTEIEKEREGEKERGKCGKRAKNLSGKRAANKFWSFVWGITFFTPLTLPDTATAPCLSPVPRSPPFVNCSCCCSFSYNVLRSTNYSQQQQQEQQKGVEIWVPDTPPYPLLYAARGVHPLSAFLFELSLLLT